MINNDPVIRFIDEVLEKQQKISDHFLTKVEEYETTMYQGEENLFKESLRELDPSDDWWADIAWAVIKERPENPDDAFIGMLVRQYLERHIKRMARIQVEEDLFNEDFIQ